MEFAQLLRIVENVRAETKFQITFKTGGRQGGFINNATMDALQVFGAMILKARALTLNNLTPILLLSRTLRSHLWRSDEHRVFVVTTTEEFNPQQFAKHVGPGIQSIEIV